MTSILRTKLLKQAEQRQTKLDPSHDWQHILRVYNLAVKIGQREKADLDVLIPAALLHDTVVYQKNHPKSKNETEESATAAERILKKMPGYPKKKIPQVLACIRECSFNKGIVPESLESRILQDADRLEATGAVAIMRTFSSGGQMNRPFYDPADPFCQHGVVNFRSGIDLFYQRLLVVEKKMHTTTAKRIARRRTRFLRSFLAELKQELKEADIFPPATKTCSRGHRFIGPGPCPKCWPGRKQGKR